ncbi:Glycerol-3-phosphate dehydrogenase (NAD(P)+) [Thalassoporum mexicanum PCC 7367]|uniref:NAD(P)H-dependent glycerol-3-phosphate dehydrogenase n=1 Tax=Thalassoporum mexicanum TaxID=3457544 RepID=UPI00029FB520|nr:NAD(P)H-dependent glycerol-3-phosphate dehydrogenase [Pseudanabaena sp. PCC 7367]AFY69140.1 Glycerol-3-phosphate dehydrogenase (NAD(P)+) [Pseudanabaena sp. PCC 7367]
MVSNLTQSLATSQEKASKNDQAQSIAGDGNNNSIAQKQITIIGAGAWGSALADLAQHNNHKVKLWSRSSEETLAEAIADAEVILSAISMKGVAETVDKLKAIGIPAQTIIITATKGLDPATTRTPSKIWQAAFPDHPVVVLSGPNLSKEIEQGLPAATVVAGIDAVATETAQVIFASDRFRVYTSNDPIGTELGGTLKNVIAIATGVCDGLNLGTNAKSALITRALPEIIRIGSQLGAQPETFFGLSGMGDLLATCSSPLSRNYRVGFGLAQGKSLEQILAEIKSTAEGVNTAKVLVHLANNERIPIPISRQVYRLLKGKITPQEAVETLMERDLKPEFCDLFEEE